MCGGGGVYRQQQKRRAAFSNTRAINQHPQEQLAVRDAQTAAAKAEATQLREDVARLTATAARMQVEIENTTAAGAGGGGGAGAGGGGGGERGKGSAGRVVWGLHCTR